MRKYALFEVNKYENALYLFSYAGGQFQINSIFPWDFSLKS